MAEIMTVRGPITPEQLGFTSMHEHTLYDGSCFRRRFEAFIPSNPPVQLDDPIRLDNLGILKHGFIMSRDAFVMSDEALMAAELAGLVALLRAGYAAQLVLGTDTFMKLLLRRYGGEGYGRLCSFVVPTLEGSASRAKTSSG